MVEIINAGLFYYNLCLVSDSCWTNFVERAGCWAKLLKMTLIAWPISYPVFWSNSFYPVKHNTLSRGIWSCHIFYNYSCNQDTGNSTYPSRVNSRRVQRGQWCEHFLSSSAVLFSYQAVCVNKEIFNKHSAGASITHYSKQILAYHDTCCGGLWRHKRYDRDISWVKKKALWLKCNHSWRNYIRSWLFGCTSRYVYIYFISEVPYSTVKATDVPCLVEAQTH